MQPLTRQDLMPLETYAGERAAFRARVIAHKQPRSVALGPNLTLLFEDRLTVQYQVQEMLRIERIFEAQPIEEELAAYNPLIPDGGNLKATMLIEFPDAEERRMALMRLKDVEHDIALEVGGARAAAIADEDLDRSDAEKTSAVHFLRFELDAAMRTALKGGAPLIIRCDHPEYRHLTQVTAATHRALVADLD
jgi:Protein of unknown function (DUF3501)